MGRYETWRLLRRGLWLAALAGFLYTVWPTPWRYTQITLDDGTYPVRIHRVTGEAQMLTPEDGWWQMGTGDPSHGDPRGGTTS